MSERVSASLKGHFLMAMPGLSDPNFYRSVTCISEHTSEGAVGIVINNVHEALSGKMIFDELGIPHVKAAEGLEIYIGGPVHANEIFVLHGPPFDWEATLQINADLALSNTKSILEAIAMGAGPKSYIISIGCAGWGPGQLELELRENVWLTGPCCRDIVFDLPAESRWEASMKRIGIDPALLSDEAGHA